MGALPPRHHPGRCRTGAVPAAAGRLLLTGGTSEDVLPYFFGVGSNGKSSFAEALAAALGDYAIVFAPEVLMEAKGERHPTELAQFMGVRLALCSEPSSSATWNDSRVKSLTGDATISARFMRGDNFTFRRTHKTIVVGNHMPKLNSVTQAIRRRIQMVPFRAVFLGCARAWDARTAEAGSARSGTGLGHCRDRALATSPVPPRRRACALLTDDYLADEDGFGQWLSETVCARLSGFRAIQRAPS